MFGGQECPHSNLKIFLFTYLIKELLVVVKNRAKDSRQDIS